MTPTQRRIYDHLVGLAAAGAPCPINAEIAALTGADDRSGSEAIVALERLGKIRVQRYSTCRRITIVATGQSTDWRLGHANCVERPMETGFRGPPPEAQRVDRDPCPRCQVRRDIGCAHSRAPIGTRMGL